MVGGVATRALTGLALICATFAWSGWVYLHTVGDPHRVESIATDVLDDPAARGQVAALLADQLVTQTGLGESVEPSVAQAVDVALGDPRVAANVISAFGSLHANALGVDDPRPTTIDTASLLSATREHLATVSPELAALLPDAILGTSGEITLPKYQPPGAGALRRIAEPATGLLAAAAVILLAGSFLLGDRRKTVRRYGTWAILAGVGWVLIPYAVVAGAKQWAPDVSSLISVVVWASARSITPAAVALVGSGVVALVVWAIPAPWGRASAPPVVSARPAPASAAGRTVLGPSQTMAGARQPMHSSTDAFVRSTEQHPVGPPPPPADRRWVAAAAPIPDPIWAASASPYQAPYEAPPQAPSSAGPAHLQMRPPDRPRSTPIPDDDGLDPWSIVFAEDPGTPKP